MNRTRLFCMAIPALMLAATGVPAFAQATGNGVTESPPTMSETEEEAVFASAVSAERRYRERLAKLRRLRDIAREEGNQRRIHELEQLMDDNHRRHDRRIQRLGELLDHKQRRAMMSAVATDRAEATDWAPRQPSVAGESVRRHVRGELEDDTASAASDTTTRRRAPGLGNATAGHRADASHGVNKRATRRVHNAAHVQVRQDRQTDRADARQGRRVEAGESRVDRRTAKRDFQDRRAEKQRQLGRQTSDLRPNLRRHVARLSSQQDADTKAKTNISVATAEAEYQLLRQEIESDR